MKFRFFMKPTAIFLMGPTASGKTDLAIQLRSSLPVEVISVDSALIYKGMDIGTAKPSKEELDLAPHRLIDILDPSESYSAMNFRDDALREMADITAHAGISATTVGRVGANAGPVLQELARSLGDAGTLLLTPHGSEWEITVYWNERSVSEGSHPFSTEHAEALLTRILTEREVQMLTPLYTRPATLEEAYLAMAEGLKR